jgi:hypothetical protein
LREGGCVGRDDDSAGCACGGGDDEVVSAAWPALAPGRGEQLGVHGSDMYAVVDDRNRRRDGLDEALAADLAASLGESTPTWSSATMIAAMATSSSSAISS